MKWDEVERPIDEYSFWKIFFCSSKIFSQIFMVIFSANYCFYISYGTKIQFFRVFSLTSGFIYWNLVIFHFDTHNCTSAVSNVSYVLSMLVLHRTFPFRWFDVAASKQCSVFFNIHKQNGFLLRRHWFFERKTRSVPVNQNTEKRIAESYT